MRSLNLRLKAKRMMRARNNLLNMYGTYTITMVLHRDFGLRADKFMKNPRF